MATNATQENQQAKEAAVRAHPCGGRCCECGTSRGLETFDTFRFSMCRLCAAVYLMNKTQAMETFALSPRDLRDLPFCFRGRRYCFLKTMLQEYACQKYGGSEGLEQKLERRQEQREQREEANESVLLDAKFLFAGLMVLAVHRFPFA
eukprot:TRINITY_DN6288_c0_g1_i1.p1 TRINITY_DN6288_c0_g1~~TRINITY_DN6288_c0_g1_i1.p1  ORF type:complete len:148 (-),score=44.74 TRINITY_DN6288_c0_g1_i1:75-518(-)